MYSSRVIFQLLAIGRRMRTIAGSRMREREVQAALNIQYVQTSVHVTFIASDHPRDGALDSAAGCEFVDDRIRLVE
jgi:hypothetical protein